jgi:heterodisulfide reductase subunit A
VVTASGADALAGQLPSYRRGKFAKERTYPEERDTSEEETRVGVFVCHCDANIGRVVDVPSVVDYSSVLETSFTRKKVFLPAPPIMLSKY